MASPSMAKRTSSNSAIRTIAWPFWARRRWDLVRVFGAINRISSDDDLVADNLLDQRSERLEVEPERHLERLVAICGHRVVAAGRRRVQRQLAAWSVRYAVAVHAGIGDEDPTRVGRRQLRRAGGVAAVGDGAVGAWVGQDLGHRVGLDRRLHVR